MRRDMMERAGSRNILSSYVLGVRPKTVLYITAKHALAGSRSRAEFGKYGITVNMISPGR